MSNLIDTFIINGTEYDIDTFIINGTAEDIDNIILNGTRYELTETVPAFVADFSGEHPKDTQFYTWEGRDYGGVIDSLSNIACSNGVADLVTKYDSVLQKWIRQMMTTGGLFESDNFVCAFKAKFDNAAGSWNNVITYGTGTHWTNGTYSDGVKWPAGGEIDAFEQAGGYSETPNTFHPVFHYGAGSNSAYPHKHDYLHITNSSLPLPVNEWAEFMFVLNDGVVTLYVNGSQVAQGDGSDLTVNNEYLWNYKPFLKPQAFYIDCKNAQSEDMESHEYHFYVKEFEIVTQSRQNTPCTALSIHPQMWQNGTTLVFPTNAKIYFDRVYTPANTSNKACTWSSSNTSVATVCQGYVETLAEGTCTITAICGEATATYTLTVSNSTTNIPCAGVIVDTNALELIVGGSVDLSSEIYKYPLFTTQNISISSSDSSVASVSGTTITGVSIGLATITVSCGSASTTVPINISSGIIYDEDVTMKTSDQTLLQQDINYDFTQTYSFQYTFGSYTSAGTNPTRNSYVGSAKSNGAGRSGGISYLGSSATWRYPKGGSYVAFTPSNGDVFTIVHDFATNKTAYYLNATALETNITEGTSYFSDTAKIIMTADNSQMTVAPTHIKIAIGDLHPTS